MADLDAGSRVRGKAYADEDATEDDGLVRKGQMDAAIAGAPGGGGGDMVKTTYDGNNDGKVDAADVADQVPWAGVQGKPADFNPSAHSHADATASAAGFMPATMFSKLNGLSTDPLPKDVANVWSDLPVSDTPLHEMRIVKSPLLLAYHRQTTGTRDEQWGVVGYLSGEAELRGTAFTSEYLFSSQGPALNVTLPAGSVVHHVTVEVDDTFQAAGQLSLTLPALSSGERADVSVRLITDSTEARSIQIKSGTSVLGTYSSFPDVPLWISYGHTKEDDGEETWKELAWGVERGLVGTDGKKIGGWEVDETDVEDAETGVSVRCMLRTLGAMRGAVALLDAATYGALFFKPAALTEEARGDALRAALELAEAQGGEKTVILPAASYDPVAGWGTPGAQVALVGTGGLTKLTVVCDGEATLKNNSSGTPVAAVQAGGTLILRGVKLVQAGLVDCSSSTGRVELENCKATDAAWHNAPTDGKGAMVLRATAFDLTSVFTLGGGGVDLELHEGSRISNASGVALTVEEPSSVRCYSGLLEGNDAGGIVTVGDAGLCYLYGGRAKNSHVTGPDVSGHEGGTMEVWPGFSWRAGRSEAYVTVKAVTPQWVRLPVVVRPDDANAIASGTYHVAYPPQDLLLVGYAPVVYGSISGAGTVDCQLKKAGSATGMGAAVTLSASVSERTEKRTLPAWKLCGTGEELTMMLTVTDFTVTEGMWVDLWGYLV